MMGWNCICEIKVCAIECLDSDKENMPPIEPITPPSLKNLSLEEEINDNDEHEATSWEANVA